MNKAEILELAERVEALEGPDRRMDGDIACAIGLLHPRDFYTATESIPAAPLYTRTPEDARRLLKMENFSKVAVGSGTKRSFAQLIRHPGGPFGGIKLASIYVSAATPALALAAAALRAHAEDMDNG